jgi:hypothetical protein
MHVRYNYPDRHEPPCLARLGVPLADRFMRMSLEPAQP